MFRLDLFEGVHLERIIYLTWAERVIVTHKNPLRRYLTSMIADGDDEESCIRKARDYPDRRAIPPAGKANAGAAGHCAATLLPLV